ncbi:amidohydrolase [Leucobacter tenebrionis]|uniref:amidohydrolase n=1 Tax=Leucobacter tenebrionis TaxID=2873270 RepID=UPI001CA6B4BE|nr:amidohydrolase [Leucobacter tenebrionis]QZY51340.1 amidohydrolase [Leucobacter tenebrionis]
MSGHATVYTNANVFIGDARLAPRECVAVADGKILAVGEEGAVRDVAGPGARYVDLGGALVTPGVIEGHTHMLLLGEALSKVQLRDASSVAEVQRRIAERRAAEPDAIAVLGVGWTFDIFADGERPTAAALDAAVSDVPVLLDGNDLHTMWVNSAALEAMGITRDTPDPVGGKFVRDTSGEATGHLLETAAMHHGWGYVESITTDRDRDRFLRSAFDAYLSTGVTGATEMSFGETEVATYRRMLDRDGRLPFPVDAYWMLTATGDSSRDLAQIDRAVEIRDTLAANYGDEWLRIVGVKFVLDGVIDACTAAMRGPYVNGELPGPIWEREFALPMAVAADSAGLQLALHGIGDEASTIALDMIEECVRANGPRAARRPRVEHLEYAADDTIARMAALNVTASMQPVHCDPAIMDNWQAVLGMPRAEGGFAWNKFRSAGVTIALGTDAPTAPHLAPDNLFIALTARSALDPSREAYQPSRVFNPEEALEAITLGCAYAAGREGSVGQLRPGYRANLAVWGVDAAALSDSPDSLIGSRPVLTLVDGVAAFEG